MNYLKVELATIADGRAIAQFNYELQRALDNCKDLATTATAVREVKLSVKIKPSEDRERAELSFQATAKLCPDAPGQDLIVFGLKGEAFVSNVRQLTLDQAGETNVEEIDAEPETGTEGETQ